MTVPWIVEIRQHPQGAVHPEAPCIRCGALTPRRGLQAVGLRQPTSLVNDFTPERFPWCSGCEGARNRAQAERIAGNPAVLMGVRAQAEAYLRETPP